MTNIEILFLVLGLIGAVGSLIAVYQWGGINENKKRKRELQYILASINSSALQKQQFWQNQISSLGEVKTEEEWEIARLHMRARDSFAEIAQQALAMEGIIDTEYSAIERIAEKGLDAIKRANKMQEEMNKVNPKSQSAKPQ